MATIVGPNQDNARWKILVIEPYHDLRVFWTCALEAFGYTVQSFPTVPAHPGQTFPLDEFNLILIEPGILSRGLLQRLVHRPIIVLTEHESVFRICKELCIPCHDKHMKRAVHLLPDIWKMFAEQDEENRIPSQFLAMKKPPEQAIQEDVPHLLPSSSPLARRSKHFLTIQ